MTESDGLTDQVQHTGSWVAHHALWLLMVAVGALGALLLSFFPEESPTDFWLHVSIVDAQEMLFWAYLMVAIAGALCIGINEIYRRTENVA